MLEPPVMISTKDCMYISDILSTKYAVIKKFQHYDGEINDAKLKKLVSAITKGLIANYDKLLEVLNNEQ